MSAVSLTSQKSKRLLLVDDDPNILDVLAEILVTDSIEIVKALNSTEALELLSRQTFSLLVCDIEIPSCSGIEVVKRLRENGNGMPVIFLSSNLSKEKMDLAAEVKPKAVLPKPFEIEDLLALVNSNLQES